MAGAKFAFARWPPANAGLHGRTDRAPAGCSEASDGPSAHRAGGIQPGLPLHPPFRDGNGRVSRLLLLLLCYHQGLEVGRYISLERLIEQNKERYYETLKLSSDGWHEGKHNPWHYVNFLLYTLLDAYKEFERRVGDTASPCGEKRGLIMDAGPCVRVSSASRRLNASVPGSVEIGLGTY